MNKIIFNLLQNAVNDFAVDYKKLSRRLFVDSEGKIIHSGEFGTYRENIAKNFLKRFIPHQFDIGTGFIITNDGKISTQCDLIVYDKEHTPIFENSDQRFFPIETVVAVIECKSVLSLTDFKSALKKLQQIKELQNHIKKRESYIYRHHSLPKIRDTSYPQDQIGTYLICERLDFDSSLLDKALSELYFRVNKTLWHNMILSIDDGVSLYKIKASGKMFYFPYFFNCDEENEFSIVKNIAGNNHIINFVNYFETQISETTINYIDLVEYIDR